MEKRKLTRKVLTSLEPETRPLLIVYVKDISDGLRSGHDEKLSVNIESE